MTQCYAIPEFGDQCINHVEVGNFVQCYLWLKVDSLQQASVTEMIKILHLYIPPKILG